MTTTHETKAARMMALYRLTVEGRLTGISDAAIGAAFGSRRETSWKDRQAIARADALYRAFSATPPTPDTYSTSQAADLLHTNRDNIHAYQRAGKLVATKDAAGRWRIPASEIERLQRDGVEQYKRGPKPRS